MAGIHLHGAEADLTRQRRVSTDEELLAGLTAGVESAGNLSAAERTIREQTAVFTGERHTLGDTLVDDIR